MNTLLKTSAICPGLIRNAARMNSEHTARSEQKRPVRAFFFFFFCMAYVPFASSALLLVHISLLVSLIWLHQDLRDQRHFRDHLLPYLWFINKDRTSKKPFYTLPFPLHNTSFCNLFSEVGYILCSGANEMAQLVNVSATKSASLSQVPKVDKDNSFSQIVP